MIHLSYLQLSGYIFYAIGAGIGIGGVIARKLERRHMIWFYGLDRYTRPLPRLSRIRTPRRSRWAYLRKLRKHHRAA